MNGEAPNRSVFNGSTGTTMPKPTDIDLQNFFSGSNVSVFEKWLQIRFYNETIYKLSFPIITI